MSLGGHTQGGHVFVVPGDVTRLSCDAWLLPTDRSFGVTRAFGQAIGLRPGERLTGYDWAGGRVCRLTQRLPDPPQVWLADVGGLPGDDPRWYAEVVDEFAAAVCTSVPEPSGRPRLTALPVIGTGKGGMADARGEINEHLIPALYASAARYGVDVVLVCWGRRAYSAAQRVRRRLLEREDYVADEAWGLDDQHRAVAERLAERSRRGELVLFIGAGLSGGAGLPGWQELLDQVNANLGTEALPAEELHRLDVRDQARLLHRRLPDGIQPALVSLLPFAHYGLGHALLAAVSAKEAVTTNFDLLYEAAVQAAEGRDTSPGEPAALAVLPYRPVRDGQRWLLKLHGSLDQKDSVVLTRDDYLASPARHGALFGLVQAMLLTRHMLFVGYSLNDEDFHQLVHEVRQARSEHWSGQLGTVITLFDDPLFGELWAEDLDVVPVRSPVRRAPTEEQLADAARQVLLLLDLVAFHSADLTGYLLDERYSGMLDDDERRLAAALKPLSALVESSTAAGRPSTPAAIKAQEVLRGFGLGPESSGP